MREKDKIQLIDLIRDNLFYKDGFFIYKDEIISTDEVKKIIRRQGFRILEKDVNEIVGELAYNTKENFEIQQHFIDKIKKKSSSGGESFYFKSMDQLYPGNKFRQLFNYYLFSDELYCFSLIGLGQTGKSTLVDVLSMIIGKEYFGRSGVTSLRNQYGGVLIEGKMLYEVAEAQDLDHDTANMLKSYITNEDIFINPKYQLQRMFKPHVKLIMTSNQLPYFRATDDGIIRRFIFIEMNKKIVRQNKNFLKEIEADIPNIIFEALQNPFNIDDFATEQTYMFENDAQYGFGYGDFEKRYGDKNVFFEGATDYEKYRSMCSLKGFRPRNKYNFDKFAQLANYYYGREQLCTLTSRGLVEVIGTDSSNDFDEEDLPF